MYKLLILDVDGTLVESRNGAKLSTEVIAAIRQAANKVKVCLCTGRIKNHVDDIISELGIKNSYHVIESGAKLINPSGRLEYVKLLKNEQIRKIVRLVGDTPKGYGFCVDGRWVKNIDDIVEGQTTIVALHSENPDNTSKIMGKLKPIEKEYNIHVGSSWFHKNGAVIHITHLEANKQFGLQYIQKKLGIKIEETIGIGDMPNDLPLFRVSGLKVAMGNADEKLKKNADVISPSLSENGVAWTVKKYIL